MWSTKTNFILSSLDFVHLCVLNYAKASKNDDNNLAARLPRLSPFYFYISVGSVFQFHLNNKFIFCDAISCSGILPAVLHTYIVAVAHFHRSFLIDASIIFIIEIVRFFRSNISLQAT